MPTWHEREQYFGVLHAAHLRKTSSLGPCTLAHSQHTCVGRMCSDVVLTDPCVCKERACFYVFVCVCVCVRVRVRVRVPE